MRRRFCWMNLHGFMYTYIPIKRYNSLSRIRSSFCFRFHSPNVIRYPPSYPPPSLPHLPFRSITFFVVCMVLNCFLSPFFRQTIRYITYIHLICMAEHSFFGAWFCLVSVFSLSMSSLKGGFYIFVAAAAAGGGGIGASVMWRFLLLLLSIPLFLLLLLLNLINESRTQQQSSTHIHSHTIVT